MFLSSIALSLLWPLFSSFMLDAGGQIPMDTIKTTGLGMITSDNMGGNLSTTPFGMGILMLPMMCTTPGQIMDSVSNTTDSNTTQMTLNTMKDQFVMSLGGFEAVANMTEQEFERALNTNICLPTGERMAEQ